MLPNFVQRMRVKPAGIALLASLTLAACGGGGGVPSSSNTPPTMVVSVVNADGGAVSSVSTTSGAFARATVRDYAGKGVPNAAVQFAGTGLAFTPASGSALTDGSGVAQVGMLASGSAGTGAVLVIASTRVGTEAVSGQVGVSIVVP